VALELADIFRRYGPAYRQKYADRLLPSHRQAMLAIERCRTEALGGQVFSCPNCGEVRYSYHSCRNRHCPKCQHEQTQEWLKLQQQLLLPVPYFMLTFTLPEGLREAASRNQKFFYHALFQASAEATQKLAQDPRYVGGQIGMVGVLHTWTRNLAYHPHVHYLVPGGGIAPDRQTLRPSSHRPDVLAGGQTWLPTHNNFFLPVKALSKLFRAKFLHLLKKSPAFTQVPPKVWQQDWVVHCKPVGNGQTALKYLAPYIFRIAISNRRLVKFTDNGTLGTSQVTFQYRTSDTGQLKSCTTSVERFIHRFLQHVLPSGFVKVRYFGFLAPTRRPLFPEGHRDDVPPSRRTSNNATRSIPLLCTIPIPPLPNLRYPKSNPSALSAASQCLSCAPSPLPYAALLESLSSLLFFPPGCASSRSLVPISHDTI